MHWLDITVIVVLALFTVIGLWRGLLRSVLDLANWLVSIVAAIFLAKPLTMLLNLMFNASEKLGMTISNSLANIGTMGTAVTQATAAGPFVNSIEGLNWFLKKLLGKFCGSGVIASGATPANYFGTLLGSICMLVISGVIAFLLIRLIIFGLSKLFKTLKKNGLINWADKIFGLLFGAIKGICIVFVCLFISSFFKWIPQINTTIESTVVTKTLSKWSTKTVDFISKNIDVKKILHGIIDNVYESVTPIPPATEPPATEPVPPVPNLTSLKTENSKTPTSPSLVLAKINDSKEFNIAPKLSLVFNDYHAFLTFDN